MISQSQTLRPFEKLALVHASPMLSEALQILLLCDRRLQDIALKGQEPLLAQMRTIWWRDQFEKPADARAKGEPLLGLMSDLEKRWPKLCLGKNASELAEAWELLAANPDAEDLEIIEKHLSARSRAIFGTYSNWSGGSQASNKAAETAGIVWAGGTIGLKRGEHRYKKLRIKPLDILVIGSRTELEAARVKRILGAFRLGIHALTSL